MHIVPTIVGERHALSQAGFVHVTHLLGMYQDEPRFVKIGPDKYGFWHCGEKTVLLVTKGGEIWWAPFSGFKRLPQDIRERLAPGGEDVSLGADAWVLILDDLERRRRDHDSPSLRPIKTKSD